MENVEMADGEDDGDGGDDGGDDAVLVMMQAQESSKAQGYVRIREGDSNRPVEYKVKGIHLFAMLHSTKEETLFTWPVLLSALTILMQCVILNGFLFAYFVSVSQKAHRTWTWDAIVFEDADGGLSEKLAGLACTLIAPLFLLVKLQSNKEFQQIAMFRAMLDKHYPADGQAGSAWPRGHFLYWAAVYQFRVVWIVPYVIFVNAAFVASTTNIRLILVMVLVAAYLLEVDDYMVQALALLGPGGEPSKEFDEHTSIKVEKSTVAACAMMHVRSVRFMTLVQGVLMIIIKLHPWMVAAWMIPVVGYVFGALTASEIPQIQSSRDLDILLVISLTVAWIYGMRCVLLPVCGEDSYFFQVESFFSTRPGIWLMSLWTDFPPPPPPMDLRPPPPSPLPPMRLSTM